MADGDSMGSMLCSQLFNDAKERTMGMHVNNEKDSSIRGDDGMGGFNLHDVGNLQISVVEGRNFEARGDGRTFRPSVELQIGEHKVRTDTLKDTLSPSWLADFNLAVPSEDSQLWVSVINSDLILDDESLVGRAAISVHDLLYSGTRVQWIQLKDGDDKSVGEICLVLRYSNCQAPSSSTAASTSSETRDDNQYGLKALLCQCPPQSSSSNVRCTPDDGHNIGRSDHTSSMITQEMLKEHEIGTLSLGSGLMAEISPTDLSTAGSHVLQMKSLFEESEASCKDVHGSDSQEKETLCGDSASCNAQHKKVAFVGTLMAFLAAMAWGIKICRKRIEDHEKKGSIAKQKH